MRGVTTSPDERWFPSHLREIDKAECLELLAGHTVGRVAYCDDLGPVASDFLLQTAGALLQLFRR